MRHLRKAILVGAAAIALVGVAGFAAEFKNTHQLDVRLPDGSLAHIRYVGETPPTVSFAPPPMALSIFSPASDLFGRGAPFAALEQISEAMDRQAEAVLHDASAQSRLALTGADLMQLPPGVQGFSMVSTMSGSGVCTRSVQYRSLADGKPQVVTRTSGSCTADQKRPVLSATAGATTAAPRPERTDRQSI